MIKLAKNKRGISHVEVIISFALFLAIVAVIFIFLRPIREPSLSSVVLDVVEEGLGTDVISTVTTIPFKIDASIFANNTGFPCFKIIHPLDIGDSAGKLHLNNVFLERTTGEAVPMDLNLSFLEVSEEHALYYLSYSFQETFPPQPLGRDCPLVPEDKILFSTPRAENFYSYNNLSALNSEYASNYVGLKNRWFLPGRNDFAMKVTDAGGHVLFEMNRPVPPRRDVFAREIEGQMLRGTDVERVTINIRVW